MLNNGSLKPLPTRIPSLDALRGVAILMVVFGHLVPARIALGDASYHVTSLGRGGVMLFFLLSGYLVFRNIERQDTATFISRRMFKIFPAYWVNVVLIAVFSFLLGKEVIPADIVLSNLFMVQDVFRKESMSGVYWTLLIEVKFYVFLAVQHLLLRDRGVLIVLAALIGINTAIWFTRGHASLLLTFFPAFYIGIQVRRAQVSGWSCYAVLQVTTVTTVVAAGLLIFDEYYANWAAIYVVLETAVLIAFLRVDISSPILGFFGRISYSHYLYHASVGYVFLALIPVMDSLTLNILVVMLVIALTTAIAFISYRFVEVPATDFGRRHESLWTSFK